MREPHQAAVIPFKRDAHELRVCLTYKPASRKWGIPKGFVDPGDTLPQAAITEAHEESGLHGTLIGEPIGTYDYDKWGNTYTVALYLMEVTGQDDHWDEESIRERHWLTTDDATQRLYDHPVRELFQRAIKLLGQPRHDA